MQSLRRIFVLAALLFCIQSLYGQQNEVAQGGCIPTRSLSEADLAYTHGEHLKFTIHYNWGAVNSDVGWATVDLDTMQVNGQKAFRCSVFGRTIRWYEKLFKVREDFRSWFTRDGLRPLRFTRDTQEGKYVAKNTYNYIWDAAEPYIDVDAYSSHMGQKNLHLPLNSCTYDLPSLFFLARNMDFNAVEPNVKYPMTFAIDDEAYNVYFILRGREVKKIKGIGQVRTIRFAAKLLEGGVFKGDEDMTIWVTDDENRLPVLFEAPILIGRVSGRLSEYEGIKYPFTSFIKK